MLANNGKTTVAIRKPRVLRWCFRFDIVPSIFLFPSSYYSFPAASSSSGPKKGYDDVWFIIVVTTAVRRQREEGEGKGEVEAQGGKKIRRKTSARIKTQHNQNIGISWKSEIWTWALCFMMIWWWWWWWMVGKKQGKNMIWSEKVSTCCCFCLRARSDWNPRWVGCSSGRIWY